MKILQSFYRLLGLLFLISFFSCQKDRVDEVPYAFSKVDIVKLESDSSSVKIKFLPDKNVVSYIYAIGDVSDYADFESGNGDVFAEAVDPADTICVNFEKLQPDHEYAIFVKSMSCKSDPGTVSMFVLKTMDNELSASVQYVTDRSVGFKIKSDMKYSEVRYFLGGIEDRDAFLKDEVQSEYLSEYEEYTVNYFELDSGADYVFYVMAYDRLGKPTDIIECPVKTDVGDGSSIPDVEFISGSMDFYRVSCSLKPNALCGKVAALISEKGGYDSYMNSYFGWKGDILSMIDLWADIDMAYVSVLGGQLDLVFETPSNLTPAKEVELFCLIYDKEMNPYGVKKFIFKTPDVDTSLPDAEVSMEISDITEQGATYKFIANENTVAFFYDTVDAVWYDEISASEDWNEYYMHNYLLAQGRWWSYGQKEVIYTELYGMSETKYYVVACPLNANGVTEGWGPMAIDSYITL